MLHNSFQSGQNYLWLIFDERVFRSVENSLELVPALSKTFVRIAESLVCDAKRLVWALRTNSFCQICNAVSHEARQIVKININLQLIYNARTKVYQQAQHQLIKKLLCGWPSPVPARWQQNSGCKVYESSGGRKAQFSELLKYISSVQEYSPAMREMIAIEFLNAYPASPSNDYEYQLIYHQNEPSLQSGCPASVTPFATLPKVSQARQIAALQTFWRGRSSSNGMPTEAFEWCSKLMLEKNNYYYD